MYFLKPYRIGINFLCITHINTIQYNTISYTVPYIQYRRYKQNISLVETSFPLDRMTGILLYLIMKYTTGFKKCFIISKYENRISLLYLCNSKLLS